MTRRVAWRDAVIVVIFVFMIHGLRDRWYLDRLYSGRYQVGVATMFLPDCACLLATLGQAVLVTKWRWVTLRGIGVFWRPIETQLAWGVATGVASYGVAWCIAEALRRTVGLEEPPWIIEFWSGASQDLVILDLLVCMITYELLFRGLLLPRLRRACGNMVLAVSLCAAVECALYRYAGWRYMLLEGATAALLCAMFTQSRSLLASTLGRFIYAYCSYLTIVNNA